MDNTVINLKGLCVRRGPGTILDHIDWVVKRNEHWVLLGSNGSGKTSLLSSLAGYLTPSEGVMEVCGKVYGHFHWGELRAMLGIVSSSVKRMIEPHFNALEITASGKGAIVNPWEEASKEDQQKARLLLADTGLTKLENRPWELLSQGERQRVLICRALMAEPRLLILDEPCTGLDPVARARFLEFVEQMAQRPDSPPIVLVTHHVEEITPSFSHALVLKNGQVLKGGPLQDVMNNKTLSDAFGHPITLTREGANNSWHLSLQ